MFYTVLISVKKLYSKESSPTNPQTQCLDYNHSHKIFTQFNAFKFPQVYVINLTMSVLDYFRSISQYLIKFDSFYCMEFINNSLITI